MTKPNEGNQPKEISPLVSEIFNAMELPFVKGGDYEPYSDFSQRRPNPVEVADGDSLDSFLEDQHAALEAFKLAQTKAKTAFFHEQKVARLGLNKDATNAAIVHKEKVVALAQKARRMKAALAQFVQALRDQKAGNWGYQSIVSGMFKNRPNTRLADDTDGGLPTKVKDRVIGEVLAETGLTREEADRLVAEQKDNIGKTLQEEIRNKIKNI